MDCVINNTEFTAFYIAAKYGAILPSGKTSGWYLPSVKQWKVLYDNTCAGIRLYLKLQAYTFSYRYATSSFMDKNYAWLFNINDGHANYELKDIRAGWSFISVRSVAAF